MMGKACDALHSVVQVCRKVAILGGQRGLDVFVLGSKLDLPCGLRFSFGGFVKVCRVFTAIL